MWCWSATVQCRYLQYFAVSPSLLQKPAPRNPITVLGKRKKQALLARVVHSVSLFTNSWSSPTRILTIIVVKHSKFKSRLLMVPRFWTIVALQLAREATQFFTRKGLSQWIKNNFFIRLLFFNPLLLQLKQHFGRWLRSNKCSWNSTLCVIYARHHR